MNEMGYVLFEDIGINHRVYHSFYLTLRNACRAQKRGRNKSNIGVMSKQEYDKLLEE